MRNFQMQAVFSATIHMQTIFSREYCCKQFLAHLLAEFATLLLPLAIHDQLGRTVFTYLFSWLFCYLLISAFNFNSTCRLASS